MYMKELMIPPDCSTANSITTRWNIQALVLIVASPAALHEVKHLKLKGGIAGSGKKTVTKQSHQRIWGRGPVENLPSK